MNFTLRLDLPSGGTIDFNDPENMRGADVKRYRRAAYDESEGQGAAANRAVAVLAELLVKAWDLPYMPGASLPDNGDTLTDVLHWRDELALENHLAPIVRALSSDGREPTRPDGTPDTSPGSPTPPASD